VSANTVSLTQALNETRTGDIWLFRGASGPDRAIQTMTNAPVNHVGMTVAVDDLPPLIWHAELGDKLLDLWTGDHHRGVQLNDAREAAERWMQNYGQRCWLRQLSPYATREQEDLALKVIARMDGTPFPSTAALAGRWLRGRVRRRAPVETTYCAEVVASTYQSMGLLGDERPANYYDPGSFWSGDELALSGGARLGDEVEVAVPQRGATRRTAQGWHGAE
jgi:hypothetical protein